MAAQTPLALEPVHQLRDRLTQGEITPVAIVEGYLSASPVMMQSSTRTSMFTPTRPGPRRTPRRPPWRLAIASARSTASRWR